VLAQPFAELEDLLGMRQRDPAGLGQRQRAALSSLATAQK